LPNLRCGKKAAPVVNELEPVINKPGERIVIERQDGKKIMSRVFDARGKILEMKKMDEIRKNIKQIMENRMKLEAAKHRGAADT